VDLISSQDTLIQLYENVNPGIVAIRVLTTNGGSLGSGFVIDKDGHIVTNYHVVRDETLLEVAFPSGFKTRGKVIGLDPDADLAVLEIEAPVEELYPLPLGDSDQVKVGQIVVAIGNPFGLEGTMTIGVISGLGRTLRSQRTGFGGSTFTVGDIVQTDAAINPGNSGGPLLNLNGEVIGVNESILTSAGERSNSGVGFAISVDMVKRIVPSLIATGKFDYPYLGIFSVDELTLMEQEALGLPRSTGVYISGVAPGGPAERAGLRAGSRTSSIPGVPAGGDLVIAVDGQPVLSFNDLIVYVTKYKNPGDVVVFTVLRGNEQLELELTLDKRPSQ
jgi:2-alkenal reductase